MKEENGLIEKDNQKLHNIISDFYELILENHLIFLKQCSEVDKNVLIKNCKLFLFPSVYEGFGMPVIEALLHGKKVITTRKASIPEVSLHKAQYVNDPYNLNEWYNKILETERKGLKISPKTQKLFSKKYSIKTISNRYLNLFKNI